MLAALPLVSFLLLTPLVQPQERTTRNVCFVMDVSGSMGGEEERKAMEAWLLLAEQPVDDYRVAVIRFGDKAERLVFTRNGKPTLWVRMPDAQASTDVAAFLHAMDGTTHVVPGLVSALRMKRKRLTVVLISDGMFVEPSRAVLQAIEREQRRRRERALIGCIVIGENAGPADTMQDIARKGLAGCWRAQ